MEIINIAKGVDVITEGCIPLNSNFIREVVNSIVEQDQYYTAKRQRIRTERKRKNISLTKRLATVFCSL